MTENKTEISTEQNGSGLKRRDFLKVAGVGAVALAIPRMGFTANDGQKSMGAIPQEEVETDVLVIGGGYAGVFAAIKARKEGVDVTLVEKGTIFKSGLSPFARGFSYFDKKKQDPDILQKYSLMIGEYLGNVPYLKMWIDLTEEVHKDLESWGVYDSRSNFPNVFRNQVIKSGVNVIERTMITDQAGWTGCRRHGLSHGRRQGCYYQGKGRYLMLRCRRFQVTRIFYQFHNSRR
jgi:hypothetical protein